MFPVAVLGATDAVNCTAWPKVDAPEEVTVVVVENCTVWTNTGDVLVL
jgi:hypothetical protein